MFVLFLSQCWSNWSAILQYQMHRARPISIYTQWFLNVYCTWAVCLHTLTSSSKSVSTLVREDDWFSVLENNKAHCCQRQLSHRRYPFWVHSFQLEWLRGFSVMCSNGAAEDLFSCLDKLTNVFFFLNLAGKSSSVISASEHVSAVVHVRVVNEQQGPTSLNTKHTSWVFGHILLLCCVVFVTILK